MFVRDVGVIGCTSKVIVPIKQLWLCVSVFYSPISLSLHDEILILTCKSFTHSTQFFATIDTIVQVQCALAITRNTCVSWNLLNCLNLFLKIKLVRHV